MSLKKLLNSDYSFNARPKSSTDTLRARIAELERERDEARGHERQLRDVVEAIATLFTVPPDQWDILHSCVKTMMDEREAAIEVHDTACRFIAEATAERDAARRELAEVRGRVDHMKEIELWIARYLSECCQTHCPINKRYGNLPNPEACEVPEVCPTKDVWVMLRGTAIEPRGGE